MKKVITPIIILSSTIIIITIGIIYYIFDQRKYNGISTPIPEFVCGTQNPLENALEGKKLFNANCAACHKLDLKSTGPALRSIDSIKYWKWLYSKNIKIDTTKFDKFGVDFHSGYYPNLTKNDLENIYKYTNTHK